jgi:hypothetical protein
MEGDTPCFRTRFTFILIWTVALRSLGELDVDYSTYLISAKELDVSKCVIDSLLITGADPLASASEPLNTYKIYNRDLEPFYRLSGVSVASRCKNSQTHPWRF